MPILLVASEYQRGVTDLIVALRAAGIDLDHTYEEASGGTTYAQYGLETQIKPPPLFVRRPLEETG